MKMSKTFLRMQINLNEEDKEKMNMFLEILKEDDDVQNVFTNAN